MDIREAIYGRRSVREYTARPIDEPTVRQLIDAAQQAPSAMNQQPWRFTVIENAAVLDEVSRNAKAHMLATMPDGPHAAQFRSQLADDSYHIFYGAPLLIVISANAQAPWILEDCAMAAQNLMLAAYGAGLGSCWIGFAQGYLNTPSGKQLAAIPAEWVPVAPIIVGAPTAPAAARPRNPADIRWLR